MEERLTIILQNGFKFIGMKLNEDDIFITIFDESKNKKMMIAKSKIERIEISEVE